MSNQTVSKIELKFCECCGGLWLRREGVTDVYCHYCAPAMMQVKRGRKKRPCSVKLMQARRAVCV